MFEIIQDYIQQNRSYQPLMPRGAVCHETATPNATDQAEHDYFNNHPGLKANAHAFVDWNSITNIVPWHEKAWSAGPTANSMFVQIELCHFDGEKFIEVWNRGVWLFAWVFINVVGDTVITVDNLMSHKEVSEKWGETDHTDPYGFFEDNGKTFDDFRSAVQEEIYRQLKGESVMLAKLNLSTQVDIPEVNIKVNGLSIPTGVILNVGGKDKSYAPVRDLAEALGATVSWDGANNTVLINEILSK